MDFHDDITETRSPFFSVKTFKQQFTLRNIIRNYAFMLLWLAFVTIVFTTIVPQDVKTTLKRFTQGSSNASNCTTSTECGNGHCLPDGPTTFTCECDKGWISRDGGICNYEQKDKLTAFLLAFFAGVFGAQYFYLASGNCCYICMGVTNLLTAGMGTI